jgi:nucleoid DNA-binding protein
LFRTFFFFLSDMAPMKAMKAMKAMVARKGAKSVTKGGLAEALATACDLKKSDCSKVLSALADVVAANLKKTGRVIVPGIARVLTRTKPATKAGKRQMFGKVCMIKARPARTVVKAFPVSALKQAI